MELVDGPKVCRIFLMLDGVRALGREGEPKVAQGVKIIEETKTRLSLLMDKQLNASIILNKIFTFRSVNRIYEE